MIFPDSRQTETKEKVQRNGKEHKKNILPFSPSVKKQAEQQQQTVLQGFRKSVIEEDDQWQEDEKKDN
ncbi:MAG: hypothetical protein Q8R88_04820 [Desulfoprunum sp.]|nr:hypothetical protein [Desulfoprunum sp.]